MGKMTQLVLFLFLLTLMSKAETGKGGTRAAFHVGVVLDLDTSVGKMGRTSILMALDDFYAAHSNYTTRLVLHFRDSNNDVLQAASAALDLLENVQVKAIIGPQKSGQAKFLADLGNKVQVPIVSFSATSPTLSSLRAPYLILMALNDSSQVNGISSIIKAFNWREVVLIYEDSDYGRGVMPYMIDALQEIYTRIPSRCVIPLTATDDQIMEQLYKLMANQTRVFIVHVLGVTGARLFSKAKEAGMMSEGYVWISTDGLTNNMNSFNKHIIDTMQGVLGLKVYVPQTRELDDFKSRWKRRYQQENPNDAEPELNTFGLWAYETAWVLAMAAEKAGITNSKLQKARIANNTMGLGNLSVSETGPELLRAIADSRFQGVTRVSKFADGLLESPTFQIINVIGNEARRIGFWTATYGISRNLSFLNASKRYSTLINDLVPVTWPGESKAVPKGWQIPAGEKKLRIGVPLGDVRVETDAVTNITTVSEHSIDVFEAVIKKVPYAIPREYIPFAGTYDDLVNQVYLKNYDAVVGDTTIRANRSEHVDFTLPYGESGVSMIVPVKESMHKNAWIFVKPLTADLWIGSLVFFFFTCSVIWVIDHHINPDFQGPVSQQLGVMLHFVFSTLVFAHREKVESFLAKLVVVIWLFVVLILTSSYTASLTSMLTLQQLQPTVTDVQQLLKNGDYVGYFKGSFVEGLLKQLQFDNSKIRAYDTLDDYAPALAKGSKNGGVSAIVEEIPYIKRFLAQHCTGYTMIGPIYKTAGFGFVFPHGSPLVSDISRAILKLTGDDMTEFEKKWFGDHKACLNQVSSVTTSNLSFRSFWGLFLITGTVSTCAAFVFLVVFLYKHWHELKNLSPDKPMWKRLSAWLEYYNKIDRTFYTFRRSNGNDAKIDVSSSIHAGNHEVAVAVNDLESRLSISNLSDLYSCPIEEDYSPPQQASPSTEITNGHFSCNCDLSSDPPDSV